MQLFGIGVFEDRKTASGLVRRNAAQRLRAFTAVMLTLAAGVPAGFAQEPSGGVAGAGAKHPEKESSQLPVAPAPVLTKPLDLRSTSRDYSNPFAPMLGNPINVYRPTTIPKADFANSVRLDNLVKDGKIYLSLSDAIALAIENNYDIAITRYNLDIADTDILRTKTGARTARSAIRAGDGHAGRVGINAGDGRRPGWHHGRIGRRRIRNRGTELDHGGRGRTPEYLDPIVTGTIQFERATAPQANTLFSGGKSSLTTNTNEYNFSYTQGFVTGAQLTAGITNTATHDGQSVFGV